LGPAAVWLCAVAPLATINAQAIPTVNRMVFRIDDRIKRNFRSAGRGLFPVRSKFAMGSIPLVIKTFPI
jgi:hypothetical protein